MGFTQHEYEILKCPFTNDDVEIDVKLVPIIKSIWNAGIETVQCCQELPAWSPMAMKFNVQAHAWIQFKTKDDCSEIANSMKDCKTIGNNLYFTFTRVP